MIFFSFFPVTMNYFIPTIFICLHLQVIVSSSDKLENPKSLLSRLQSLDNDGSKSSEEELDENTAEIDVRNPLSTVKIDYDNNVITLESRGYWPKEEDQKRAYNKNFMRFGKRQYEVVTNNDVKQYEDRDDSKEDDFPRYSRPASFMRFGRGNDFMRFGKRASGDFLRFGRANDFMRFGRASGNNFMRFGRSGNRYGRSSDSFFSGKKVDNNFMRFGRPDSFMRFGRSNGLSSDSKPLTTDENKS